MLRHRFVNLQSATLRIGAERFRQRRCPATWAAGLALLAACAVTPNLHATVIPFFGVQAQQWMLSNGGMKMDYDWVRDRFVIQYQYGSIPPRYATIDLTTQAFAHLASTNGMHYETLLTVLPSPWAGYQQGTTFVPRGGGGEIYAIDPSGAPVTTFATGLPGGGAGPTNYSTVRRDDFGVANNDLFYCNEGTGHVVRVNASGNPVWTTMLRRPDSSPARPEAMLVLGSNPRWGPYQNHLLVGENDVVTYNYLVDPGTGAWAPMNPPLGQVIGGTAESFRIYPFSGGNLALYLSLYNGSASTIWQLTNLGAIPNLQPGDLFVARETVLGGEVWHVYFDPQNQLVAQQVVSISGDGYLEDMVFAPVPEPSSAVLLWAALSAALLRRR